MSLIILTRATTTFFTQFCRSRCSLSICPKIFPLCRLFFAIHCFFGARLVILPSYLCPTGRKIRGNFELDNFNTRYNDIFTPFCRSRYSLSTCPKISPLFRLSFAIHCFFGALLVILPLYLCPTGRKIRGKFDLDNFNTRYHDIFYTILYISLYSIDLPENIPSFPLSQAVFPKYVAPPNLRYPFCAAPLVLPF